MQEEGQEMREMRGEEMGGEERRGERRRGRWGEERRLSEPKQR